MADSDVNIVGLDGVAPPMWATEETLDQMLNKIGELVSITNKQRNELKKGISGGSSGGSSPADKKREKEQKKATNLLGALSNGLKETTKSAAEAASGFNNLPGPLAKFGKELKNTSGATKMAALGVGMIGNQIGKAIAGVKETTSTLRDLSDSGIKMHGGLLEVQQGLGATGMTIQQFGETASKYAQIINQKGWKSVSNLATVVNESAGGFKKWGMTTAEGIDITAEYLDQQRRVGMFQAMDQTKQSALIKETMDRLTAYSKVLNVSRTDMLAARRDMKTNRDVQAQLALMDVEDRKKAEKGYNSLSDSISVYGSDLDFLGAAVTDLAGNKIPMLSQTFIDTARGGGADAIMELSNMVQNAKGGAEANKEMVAEWVKAHGSNSALIQNLINAGGEAKVFGTNMAIAVKTIEEAEAQEARLRERGGKKYQESVDENVQTLTGLEDVIQKVQASFEYKRIEGFLGLLGGVGTDAVELATKGLTKLHEGIMAFDAGGAATKFREMVLENPAASALALVAAFATLNIASLAAAGKMAAASSAVGKFAKGAGMAGAAFAGWQLGTAAGSAFYNKYENTEGMIGFGDWLGDKVDFWRGAFGNEEAQSRRNGGTTANYDIEEIRRRQREHRERQAKLNPGGAESSISSAETPVGGELPTTSTDSTTGNETKTMTEAEIAQLSVSERQLYYAAENLRELRRMRRTFTGDTFN